VSEQDREQATSEEHLARGAELGIAKGPLLTSGIEALLANKVDAHRPPVADQVIEEETGSVISFKADLANELIAEDLCAKYALGARFAAIAAEVSGEAIEVGLNPRSGGAIDYERPVRDLKR
jgi:hypothetical protein